MEAVHVDCTVVFAVILSKSLDHMLRGIVFQATHRPPDIWALTFPGVRGDVLFEVSDTFPNLLDIQVSTDEGACVFIRLIVLVPRVTFRDANPTLCEVHLLCIVVLASFWDIRPRQVSVTKSLRE